MSESDEPTTKPDRSGNEEKAEEECVAATVGHISGVYRWFCCRLTEGAFAIRF